MECELQPLFNVEETGVHAYLLTLNDTLLLVDCGLAPPYDVYLRAYDDYLEKISAILITSAAMEHAGACFYILSRKNVKIFIPTGLVPFLHATVLHTFINLCIDMKGHQPVLDYLLLDFAKLERLFNSSFIQSPEEVNVISITQSILGSYHRINADEYFWSLQLPPSTNKVICMPSCHYRSLEVLQNRGGYQSLERSIALDLPLSSRHLRGELCFTTPLSLPKSVMNLPMLDINAIIKLLERAFVPITDQNSQSSAQYTKTLFVCDGLTGLTNVLALLSLALEKYLSRPTTGKRNIQVDGAERRSSYKICLLMDEQVFSHYLAYLRTISMDDVIDSAFYITSRAHQLDVTLSFPLFILTPDPYFMSGSARQLLFSNSFTSNPANIIVMTAIRPYLPKTARGTPGYKLLSLILLRSQGKSVPASTKITAPQLTIVDKETYQKQLTDAATDSKPQKTRQPEAADGAALTPEARNRYILTNISLIPGIVASAYFNMTTRELHSTIDMELSMIFLRKILGIDQNHMFMEPADVYKDVTLESPPHIRFDMLTVSALVHYIAIGYDISGYKTKNMGRVPVVKVAGKEIRAYGQMDSQTSVLTKYGVKLAPNLAFSVEPSSTEQDNIMLPYLFFLAEANSLAAQASAPGTKVTGPGAEKLKDMGVQSGSFQQRLKAFFMFIVISFLKEVTPVYNPITDELHLTYKAAAEINMDADEDQGFDGKNAEFAPQHLKNYGYMCNQDVSEPIREVESKVTEAPTNVLHSISDMHSHASAFSEAETPLPFLNTQLSPLDNIYLIRHRQVQRFIASIKTIIAEKKETATLSKLSDARATDMYCEETIKIEKSDKVYRILTSPTLLDSVTCSCDLIFLLDEPIMQLQDMADLLRGRFKKYIVATSKKLHQASFASTHLSDFTNNLLFTTGETIPFSLQDQVPKAYFPMCKNLAFKKIDRKISISRGYFSAKIDNGIALEVESTHPYDESVELVLLNCHDNNDERKQALRKAFNNTLLSMEHNNKFVLRRNTIELNDAGQMTISGNISTEILDILECVHDSKIYLPL